MTSQNDLIHIKGLRDGLLISLGAGEWDLLQGLLFEQIDERPAFFKGARLAIDVGEQILRVTELSDLRDQLSERDVSLWAVVSESPKTVQTAQLLGLATKISKQRPTVQARQPVAEAMPSDGALWLNKTLRSGTRIEYEGNVVVMGDVNPGAEIVAGGDILVWGRLRGAVHAGASEKESASVSALEMQPTRMQIASEIGNLPKMGKGPQKIILKNGKFLAQGWQEK
jgi:septum site-determining protein MinC